MAVTTLVVSCHRAGCHHHHPQGPQAAPLMPLSLLFLPVPRSTTCHSPLPQQQPPCTAPAAWTDLLPPTKGLEGPGRTSPTANQTLPLTCPQWYGFCLRCVFFNCVFSHKRGTADGMGLTSKVWHTCRRSDCSSFPARQEPAMYPGGSVTIVQSN